MPAFPARLCKVGNFVMLVAGILQPAYQQLKMLALLFFFHIWHFPVFNHFMQGSIRFYCECITREMRNTEVNSLLYIALPLLVRKRGGTIYEINCNISKS